MAKNRARIVAAWPGGSRSWKICDPGRDRRRHECVAKTHANHIDQAVRSTGEESSRPARRRNRMRRRTLGTLAQPATKDFERTRCARLHYFFRCNITRDGPSVSAKQK